VFIWNKEEEKKKITHGTHTYKEQKKKKNTAELNSARGRKEKGTHHKMGTPPPYIFQFQNNA
jgi:hypothetical protein